MPARANDVFDGGSSASSGMPSACRPSQHLNQCTAVGGVTPTYDGNGNLTADGTYALGYDADSRLVSASGPS